MAWRLWFVQLSGWPVFLAIVAGVFLFMLGLSVFLTRISNRSVAQNAALAVISLAAIACAVVILLAVLTRR